MSAVPLLPQELFEACPVQHLQFGRLEVDLKACQDIDQLLDFYADTQPSNSNAIPYYAIVWDAALALAGELARRPAELQGRRVIELGCGLGLPSIVAALSGATVVATDFHPDCAAFLLHNAHRNNVQIEFRPLDWAAVPSDWEEFDLVLASDVIYHAPALPALVAAASRLCHTDGRILFADPGRDRLQAAVDAFAARGYRGDFNAIDNVFVFDLQYQPDPV